MAPLDSLAVSPASRPTWPTLLSQGQPLLLPAALDTLTARLIARAGFEAYQVGGFALAGARYAFPDIAKSRREGKLSKSFHFASNRFKWLKRGKAPGAHRYGECSTHRSSRKRKPIFRNE